MGASPAPTEDGRSGTVRAVSHSALVPGDLVMRRVEDDNVGLRFEGQEWTWRQVVAEARARAALLEERRGPGPFHVGVLLENTPEYVFLLTAAALSGAVIVGVNPTRRGEELATDIRHTDCQLFITDTDPGRTSSTGSTSASTAERVVPRRLARPPRRSRPPRGRRPRRSDSRTPRTCSC